MKKLNVLSEGVPLNFFNFFKNPCKFSLIPKVLGVIIVIISIYLIQGCNFMIVRSNDYPPTSDLSKHLSMHKTIVVHIPDKVFYLDRCYIEGDSIKGYFGGDYQMPYGKTAFPDVNTTVRYRINADSRLLNEVHIYLPTDKFSIKSISGFWINGIYRIDVYEPNRKATTASFVFGSLGLGVGLLITIPFVILLIAALSGSCPYVYVNNGSEYVLTGDIYSGAIYAPLERNDYLKLPELVAQDGIYKLKISNELKEMQFNNLAELMVIDHPENTSVLVDKNGNYQSFSKLQKPMTAINSNGTDIKKLIEANDDLTYIGPLAVSDIPAVDKLEFTFDLPENARSAKLLINAKNSEWLDYMYKNIGDLLGTYGPKWRVRQNNSDKDKLISSMISQKLPLAVYVERNGEWEFYDYFNMAGALMMKEDVIPIDIGKYPDRPLKVKLEAGSFFWQINYVAMDCSDNVPVEIRNIRVGKAITEKEEQVSDLLKYDDLKYYIQDREFNSAELSFPAPENGKGERTVILHSKGYYQQNYGGEGMPHISKLKKLQKPGQFPEFSKQLLYSEIEKLTGKKR